MFAITISPSPSRHRFLLGCGHLLCLRSHLDHKSFVFMFHVSFDHFDFDHFHLHSSSHHHAIDFMSSCSLVLLCCVVGVGPTSLEVGASWMEVELLDNAIVLLSCGSMAVLSWEWTMPWLQNNEWPCSRIELFRCIEGGAQS